jgi:hypothetical protein
MRYSACIITVLAVVIPFAIPASAQDPPTNAQPSQQPSKAPKPKSRLSLLRQMQIDFDMAVPHAHVEGKDQKRLDKCHEVFIDAVAQQQRYKSVNVGKVKGCLKDLDRLLEAGAFAAPDRDKLLQDSQRLSESIGKPHRIRLPQPL